MSYKKQTFANGQILEAGHLNHIEEGISNAIVSPETAKVGQTIVVKAVDDDGKPTEWESVDIPTTLPASDVSDWAKATTKPTYTAAEVGALPANTDIPSVDGLVSEKTLSETLEEYAKTEDVSKEENARKEEIAVERARIDKFTTLPEGSTTGDAELQDIRIGYDGTTYENAGTAVREQIKNVPRLEVGESTPTDDSVRLWINPDGDEEINVPEINDSEVNPEDTWSSEKINAELSQLSGDLAELAKKSNNLFDVGGIVKGKYINNVGEIADSTNWCYLPIYIPAKKGDKINVTSGGTCFINFYKEDKSTTTSDMNMYRVLNDTNGYSYTITGSNVAFIRISVKMSEYDLNTFMMNLGEDILPFEQFGKALILDDNSKLMFKDIALIATLRHKITIEHTDDINDFYNSMKSVYEIGNCDVYIRGGDYVYTDSFCDMLMDSNEKGILIGKNNRYFFDSKARLICDYRGSKESTSNLFVLNTTYDGVGYFELHNLTLLASNVCYGIHDEYRGRNEPYRNVYEHCFIKVDNTGYSSGAYATNKCIGGGLGANSEVIIDGCYFEATTDDLEDVSYHGNTNDTSHLLVKNSYFKHTLALNTPVSQTDEKTLIFCGNSLGQELYYQSEEARSAWNVFAWNNEIRNS